jgi:hypothetical protein
MSYTYNKRRLWEIIMKTYIKVALFLIGLAAFLYGASALAMDNDGLRCGNALIAIGDAQYLVIQECGQPIYSHHTGGGPQGGGDQEFMYWKVASNLTSEVQFIDGHVYSIHDIYN